MPSEPAIVVDRLSVRYGATDAVIDVSLTAAAGQVTALLGPNGAGKTSTVDVISGLRRPHSGTVRIHGLHPDDPALKPRIGVMMQTGGLFPTARPLEWLRYLAKLYPDPAVPVALLERVGLDPTMRTTARRMSGGEQQRLKLAAALLPRPSVLVLDEPTAGLDPLARRNLLATIHEQRAAGVAILLTTHLLADVEQLADHVVVLSAGRVLMAGSIDDLTGTGQALSFTAPAGLDVAALAAALPEGYSVQEPQPGRYLVHGEPTPDVLATVTGWCAARGVMTTDLRTGRQTLEDIVIDAARRPQ